jgi:hypothetical protein
MRTPVPLSPASCRAILASPRWRVEAQGDCIVWTGALSGGYGRVSVDGRQRYVHRVAFVATTGADLPNDAVLDHTCRQRACVRVAHLEVTTNDDNIARGEWKGSAGVRYRGTCQRGHEIAPGKGYCVPCHNAAERERRARIRAAAARLGITARAYVAEYGSSGVDALGR